jgi:hypothetical protein
MSESEDYEYESESETDEPIPQEYFWQELYRRIHIKNNQIQIELFEDDDWSVLYTLLETIKKGITHQELIWNRQIELIHNIIIRNASKNAGQGRLKELRHIETLLAEYKNPKLFQTDIFFVKLELKIDVKHLMYLNVMCPNIKKLCLNQTFPLQSKKMFQQLFYLECSGPNIKNLPCNLREIFVKNARHFSGIVQHPKITNIYLKDCIVLDWEFRYLFKKIMVTENTIVKVWDEQKKIFYDCSAVEFTKKLENKKKQFNIPPFKCN